MATSAREAGEISPTVRLLLTCGVVGPLLFIVVFLIEGATRPDYSALRHFVSLLSLGPDGWVQILSFVVSGGLIACFAVGLRMVLVKGKGATWGPILLAAFGLSLVAAGIFSTDPSLGYPPGASTAITARGAIHMLVSLIAFATLAAACFVLARRFPGDPEWRGWRLYSIVTGILVLGFFIATDVVANLGPEAPAGLVQRITIILGWVWVALLALRLIRVGPPLGK